MSFHTQTENALNILLLTPSCATIILIFLLERKQAGFTPLLRIGNNGDNFEKNGALTRCNMKKMKFIFLKRIKVL